MGAWLLEMCTLALYTRVAPHLPMLVAANRDEFLARPTAAPRVVSLHPWVVAGQDLEAGGTWLGLNERGIVVGLLNRRSGTPPRADLKSRGILCLRALQCESLEEIEEMLAAERACRYNPFTLMAASRERAWVGTPRGDDIKVRPLEAGLHLLTNLEVDDPTCPRIARSHELFASVEPRPVDRGEALLRDLRAVLSNHSRQLDPQSLEEDDSICIHRGSYGTRSSTVIALGPEGASAYWHASEAPCRTEYVPIALPRSS